jgi:shikimate dehydrogenase
MLHGYWLRMLGIHGTYELADVPEANFPDFLHTLKARGFAGGNITVPHKEAAFRRVDCRDEAATAIGAVNTVWYEDDELRGGNTDAYGFVAHLEASAPGWDRSVRRSVVLGAGGAARAIVYALRARGVDVAVANRTRARAEDLVAHFAGATAHAWDELPGLLGAADLLVNATSLGMSGKVPLALDLAPLSREAIVYDIVYVPLETELLRDARGRGLRTVDGLGMLLHQAVPGFARWFGVTPRVTPDLRAVIEADIRAKTGGT